MAVREAPEVAALGHEPGFGGERHFVAIRAQPWREVEFLVSFEETIAFGWTGRFALERALAGVGRVFAGDRQRGLAVGRARGAFRVRAAGYATRLITLSRESLPQRFRVGRFEPFLGERRR